MMKLEKTCTHFWLENCKERQHFGDLPVHADKREILSLGLWSKKKLPTFTVPSIFCTHISYIIFSKFLKV